MGFEARIYDGEESPNGKLVSDLPDKFLSVAITHARKSPGRYPMLSRVELVGRTVFGGLDRDGLKLEWLAIESLAIGPKERDKWNVIFKALTRQATFQGLEFAGD